jgi:hypothetical protein
LTSAGPEGTVACGVDWGVVRGVVWLVVAPQPSVAMALNRIVLRIKDIAESSTVVEATWVPGGSVIDEA